MPQKSNNQLDKPVTFSSETQPFQIGNIIIINYSHILVN